MGSSGDRYKQKAIVKYGKRLRKVFNRVIARYSLVDDVPVFTDNTFEWTGMLEAEWETVREELRDVMKWRQAIPALSDISPDHERLTSDGKWQSFFLWGYGYRSDVNCERCPKTAALVEKIPGLKTAMFSIHAPGIHIPRHKGVTKGMVVCHLGLTVPKNRENCRMRVADETCHWSEGKAFVFDDTYPHEVWNDTDEDRVILLLQVERPMYGPGLLAARLFMNLIRLSPFVRDARRKWHDRGLPGDMQHA